MRPGLQPCSKARPGIQAQMRLRLQPCSKVRPGIQARHASCCGTAACPKRAAAPHPTHPVTVVPCKGALASSSAPSAAAAEPERAIDTLNPVTVTEVTRPEVRPGWRGVRTQPAGPLVKQVACGTRGELKESRRESQRAPAMSNGSRPTDVPPNAHTAEHALAPHVPAALRGPLPHSHPRRGTSRRHSQACPSRCCSNQRPSGSTCRCRARGRRP